jgi:hypothetical protein
VRVLDAAGQAARAALLALVSITSRGFDAMTVHAVA